MKGLVLAGGTGNRLRPITHTWAKQLLPLGNKPVLCYALEAIRQAAIVDVGVVVGGNARAIQMAVGDGAEFGLDITYIRQEAPLGLAHAVRSANRYLGDEDFVMYLGDVFLANGVTEIVRDFLRARPCAQVAVAPVARPEHFGIAELGRGGQLVGLQEKPEHPKSDLAAVGVYVLSPLIHEAIRQIRPSRRGELEITDAIQWLIDAGNSVRSSMITSFWRDTGSIADLLEANRVVLEGIEQSVRGAVDDDSELIGRVSVMRDAQVSRSRIVGPVVIGDGARVVNSYVGPFTSIAADCDISDSEIEYSIMMAGSSIHGIRRIEASLLGREARIMPSPAVRQAHRMVLCDHSRIHLGL